MDAFLKPEEKEEFLRVVADVGKQTLNESEISAMKQLMEHVQNNGAEYTCQELQEKTIPNGFTLTSAFVLRFMVARNFDAKKASSFLKEHLEWRNKFNPSLLKSDLIIPLLLHSNILRYFGKTSDDKPIILFSLPYLDRMKKTSKNLNVSVDEYVKYVVFFIEQTLKKLDAGKCVWIFDLDGWGVTTHGTSVAAGSVNDIIRQVLVLCQNQYPERLAKALILNSPWLFSTAWSVISSWLDKPTQAKVEFLSKKKDLLKHIPKEQLLVSYGGSHPGHQIEFD